MKYGLRKEGRSPDSKQEWRHIMENNLTFLKVEISFLKQQLQESNRRIEKLEGNLFASSSNGKCKGGPISGKDNFQNRIYTLPVVRDVSPSRSLFTRPSWWQYPTCGTRSTPYQPSCSRDFTSTKPAVARVNCITAMPQYRDHSLEELRYQDYVARDGLNTHQFIGPNFTGRNNVFGDTNQPFGPSTTNPGVEYQLFGPKKIGFQPFDQCGPSSTTTSGIGSIKFGEQPFGPLTTNQPFGPSTTNQPFGPSSINQPFGPSSTNQPFCPSTINQPFGPPNINQPFGPSTINQPFGPPNINQPFGPPNINQPLGPSTTNQPFAPSSTNQPFGPSSTTTGVIGSKKFGDQPFGPTPTTGVIGSNKFGDQPFCPSSTTTGVIGPYTFGYQPFGQSFGPSPTTTGVIGSNKFGDQPFGQSFGPSSTTTGVIGPYTFGYQPFGQCFGPPSTTAGVIGCNKFGYQPFGQSFGPSTTTTGVIGSNKFGYQPFGQNVGPPTTTTGVIGSNKFVDQPFGGLFSSSATTPHAAGSFKFGYQSSGPFFGGPSFIAPSVIGRNNFCNQIFGSTIATASPGFGCTNNQTQNVKIKELCSNNKTVIQPNKPKPLECEFGFIEEEEDLENAEELEKAEEQLLVDTAVQLGLNNKDDKELCSNNGKDKHPDTQRPVGYEFDYKKDSEKAGTLLLVEFAVQNENIHKSSAEIHNTHTSSQSVSNKPENTDDCNPEIQTEMLSQVLAKLNMMEEYFHNVNGSLISVDHHLADMRSCVSLMDSRLSAIDMFVTMQKFDKKWQGLEPSLESLDVTPVKKHKEPFDMECTPAEVFNVTPVKGSRTSIIGDTSVASSSIKTDPSLNSSAIFSDDEETSPNASSTPRPSGKTSLSNVFNPKISPLSKPSQQVGSPDKYFSSRKNSKTLFVNKSGIFMKTGMPSYRSNSTTVKKSLDRQNWGTPNPDSLGNTDGENQKELILLESTARNEQDNTVAGTKGQESSIKSDDKGKADNEPRKVERLENVMSKMKHESLKSCESLAEAKVMNVKESFVESTADNPKTSKTSESRYNVGTNLIPVSNSWKNIQSNPNMLENVIGPEIANEQVTSDAGTLNKEEKKYDTDDEFVVVEKSHLSETDKPCRESEQCCRLSSCGNKHPELCSNVTQYMEVHCGRNPVSGFQFESKPDSSTSGTMLEVSVRDTLDEDASKITLTDNLARYDSFSTFIENLIYSRSEKPSPPNPAAEKCPEYQKSFFKSRDSSQLYVFEGPTEPNPPSMEAVKT